jgi:hypothetical protein
MVRAFERLRLFRGDPALRTQAVNLAIVDRFLTDLEYKLMRERFKQEAALAPETLFLSAQSQMWIFAAYELMRTWRQRAKDIIKWSDNGSLKDKLAALERKNARQHHAASVAGNPRVPRGRIPRAPARLQHRRFRAQWRIS